VTIRMTAAGLTTLSESRPDHNTTAPALLRGFGRTLRFVNGRRARHLRLVDSFEPTDPGVAEIRAMLFGDRFKAGFGHKDPAYMPLTPHEAAAYLFSRGATRWDKYHSAEELEAYINQVPPVEQLGPDDRSERWYDNSCRLAAKWILGRLRAVPADARLVLTFWEEMESIFPHLVTFRLATAQQNWVRAAALRLFDADRYDAQT
jgi:hypothetical protein